MRALFSSLAAHGHTYPLLPLATAARAAGHDVSFATGSVLHPALRAVGFEPIAAGMSITEAAPEAVRELFGDDAADLTPEQLRSVGATAFGSVLPRRFLADLEPVLCEREPELVIFDGANSGAELAARRLLGGPECRESAGGIAAEIESMPSPAEIVERLPELAGRCRDS